MPPLFFVLQLERETANGDRQDLRIRYVEELKCFLFVFNSEGAEVNLSLNFTIFSPNSLCPQPLKVFKNATNSTVQFGKLQMICVVALTAGISKPTSSVCCFTALFPRILQTLSMPRKKGRCTCRFQLCEPFRRGRRNRTERHR